MKKKSSTAQHEEYDAETTDELVGVLTAISIVSRRLARNLALLEESRNMQGEDAHEKDESRKSTVPD